jgi:hypothetical protein
MVRGTPETTTFLLVDGDTQDEMPISRPLIFARFTIASMHQIDYDLMHAYYDHPGR